MYASDLFINNAESKQENMETLFPKTMAAERCKKSKIYFDFAIHFVAVVIGRKKFDSCC